MGHFYEAKLVGTYQISVGIDRLNWPECQYLRHQRFCDSGWTPSFSSGSPMLAKRLAANSASSAPISSTFSFRDAKTRSTPVTNTKQRQFTILQALLNRVCTAPATANANRKQTKTGCCFARCASTSSESQADWLFPSRHRELGYCEGTARRGGGRGKGGVEQIKYKTKSRLVHKPECI